MQRRSWLCQSITGAAIPACSITVYTAGTLTKATIYGDQAGSSSLGNPITAGSDGTYAYYAPSGRYTEVLSAPGFTFGAAQTQDFILHDPFAIPATAPNVFATTTWLNATPNCLNIPSPTTGKTWCFDQTLRALKVYDGVKFATLPTANGYIPVNVQDFGAKGDNLTDDSTAIQNAINFALNNIGNGTVYFPPATYVVNSTLAIPITAQYFTMLGYGAQIRCKMNADCITIGDTTTPNNHASAITIAGFLITGNGGTDVTQPLQNGIGIYSVLGLVLRDVVINNIPNIGIKAVKSAASGSAYMNMVQFDHIQVRFTGFQGVSYCETGASCDDITIVGSLFNNLGMQQTSSSNGLGAVFLGSFSTHIAMSEFSTIQNANTTQGYGPALHIASGAAVLSALHFENNGANQANSVDLHLDAGTDGSTVSGMSCQESQATGVNTCVRIRAANITITGLQQCSSGSHTINTVVDAGAASASNFFVTGLSSCTGATAPTTWLTTSGGGTGVWVDQNGLLNASGTASIASVTVTNMFAASATVTNTVTAASGAITNNLVVGAAAGKGTGTINIATANGYYAAGVQIATMTLTNASGTTFNAAHMVQDTVTLTAGTAGVALAGAAAFANSTSYTCVCDNDSAVLACRVVQNGGNGFTVSSGAGTDVVRFICVGS